MERQDEVIMPSKHTSNIQQDTPLRELKFLSPRQVHMIDDLLSSVGKYGEVRLQVKDGRLRFASKTESMDALRWEQEDS